MNDATRTKIKPGNLCAGGHLLTEAMIYVHPNGAHSCRACRDAAHRRFRGYPPKPWTPRSTPEERFWSKVDRRGPDDCWSWQGWRQQPSGHGLTAKLKWDGKGARMEGAHRRAWMLTFGQIPEGLHVLHHCDNPPCCNPAHLFIGTHQDNMLDMHAKGRDRNQFSGL